ncbi:MAG: hypothetical protein ACFFC7_17125 [Candidatus Hermodarchaeota archaeon]
MNRYYRYNEITIDLKINPLFAHEVTENSPIKRQTARFENVNKFIVFFKKLD